MEKEKKLLHAIAFIYHYTNLECKFFNNIDARRMLFKLKQKQQIKMSLNKTISVKPHFFVTLQIAKQINNNK